MVSCKEGAGSLLSCMSERPNQDHSYCNLFLVLAGNLDQGLKFHGQRIQAFATFWFGKSFSLYYVYTRTSVLFRNADVSN